MQDIEIKSQILEILLRVIFRNIIRVFNTAKQETGVTLEVVFVVLCAFEHIYHQGFLEGTRAVAYDGGSDGSLQFFSHSLPSALPFSSLFIS